VRAETTNRGGNAVTTSSDGTTRLWDLTGEEPVGGSLPGGGGGSVAAAFVRAGTRLAIVHADGHGDLWNVLPSAWMRRACRVAGRTLTPEEWAALLPSEPYAPACRDGR
jgi:hypothetical protein